MQKTDFALFLAVYMVPPVLLLWGWLRWVLQPKMRTLPSILSMIGFILATISAFLAISTIAYAQVHPFPFYDPTLLRIFRCGALLSVAGIVTGLGGITRPNPLRWHTPSSAVAMLFFWIVMASGE